MRIAALHGCRYPGDNLSGFSTIKDPGVYDLSDPSQLRLLVRELTLAAALKQAALYVDGVGEPWHLDWDDEYQRLEGTLHDLPVALIATSTSIPMVTCACSMALSRPQRSPASSA